MPEDTKVPTGLAAGATFLGFMFISSLKQQPTVLEGLVVYVILVFVFLAIRWAIIAEGRGK